MSLPNKQSYNNLGGELTDYSPVTNPTTDLSAAASNESRSDVAAMTRTAIRAWVGFTVSGTTISVASSDYDAVYGNANVYKPTGAYVSTGTYDITFPSSVVDARGNTQTVNLSVGWVNVDGVNNNGYVGTCQKTASNVFRVYVYSTVDGGIEDATNKIVLFVM